MKAVLICGNAAKESRLKNLLEEISQNLSGQNTESRLWTVAEKNIPILDPGKIVKNKEIQELIHLVEGAELVVVGSPIYHGSLSGAIKNVFDHLPRDIFKNKKVVLVSTSGNIRNARQLFPHFRFVIRELEGEVLYTQIGACMDDFAKNTNGYKLESEKIHQEIEELAEEIARIFNK